MTFYFPTIIILSFIALLPLQGQSIAEKKVYLDQPSCDLDDHLSVDLAQVNDQLRELKRRLQDLYQQANLLYSTDAPTQRFGQLLEEINSVKRAVASIESAWREQACEANQENYSLWHHPETTIGQLIIDYGSQDFVYLIPPEASIMRLSVDSHLPIPRESWREMIELILAQNGLGIRQLNPYLRQIYLMKQEMLGLAIITNRREELDLLPSHDRVCFVLSTPELADPNSITQFLSRFINNAEKIRLQLIGKQLFLIAQVQEIKELLTIYDFIQFNGCEKEYKLLTVCRLDTEEMEKVLRVYFTHEADKQNKPFQSTDLKILPIKGTRSLFVMGNREQVSRAEEIITEVEEQLEDPREKVLYWYTCRHTQAEEVAKVLDQIYQLMVCHPSCFMPAPPQSEQSVVVNCPVPEPLPYYREGIPDQICDPYLVVRPDPVVPINPCPPPPIPYYKPCLDNFIVDPKSGSIIMVVERELLPRIKDLLKVLDLPKKMVQIEVLLFEKKVNDQTNFGLNLLRLGSRASHHNHSSAGWNDVGPHSPGNGILSFFISRMRGGGLPAFDLAYNFLLSQEDIQINACPSITTVNQTSAKIALVEEISVNTGVVEYDGNSCPILKDSFTRNQYGITIELLPTIHFPEGADGEICEDGTYYITLDTNITFDTTKPSVVNRPEVTRRNIVNQVRIPDGQTVILGGLRRKTCHDQFDRIPFLGDIPGVGKLFGNTRLCDSQTEMFIFLTPRILNDPVNDLHRMRCIELHKRPGDTPEFLRCLLEARECERRKAFDGGMRMLFGRQGFCQ